MNPPQVFLTVCKIVGMNDERAKSAWSSLIEKVNKDLFDWLINDAGLSEENLKKLEEIFNKLLSGEIPAGQPVLAVLSPVTADLKDVNIKYGDIFVKNLEEFYDAVTKNSSTEEKQVIKGYLGSLYK